MGLNAVRSQGDNERLVRESLRIGRLEVEARFDPRRILKVNQLSAISVDVGVEARFDPRRILKVMMSGAAWATCCVEARFDPRRILKVQYR